VKKFLTFQVGRGIIVKKRGGKRAFLGFLLSKTKGRFFEGEKIGIFIR
jgi:hypothetical protein